MLIKAQIEMRAQEWSEAKQTLESAFNLPGVKDGAPQKQSAAQRKYNLPFGLQERAKIFLSLVEVYGALKEFDTAKKTLQRAIAEFSGTSEEVKVILAQSDLNLKMGDIQKSLNMLKKVESTQADFIEAKKKMAEIYNNELKDRKGYTRCYMEIIDVDPSPQNYKMVGNALMDIQEPEEAIRFYEKAREQKEDSALVREVGKALVMTHDYNKAIRYYENALREDPKLLDLRTDLAELYIKLKGFEDAKRILIEALKYLKHFDPNDLEFKAKNVHYYMLMAKVFLEEDVQSGYWQGKDNQDAKQALREARNMQMEVIDKCREISTDRLDEERAIAAEINFKLGKYFEEREANVQSAMEAYNDCLNKCDSHIEALIAIARISQAKGNTEECVQYCQRLLKIDPSNEELQSMMANIMLNKEEADGAIDAYRKLLEQKPDNFKALSQFITLMKRAGRLKDIPKFLETAEKACARSTDAGLAYCRGLYHRYTNEPQKALKELNTARFDNQYGKDAHVKMIEIYLNPHNELIWSCQNTENVYTPTNENIMAAEQLIKDLHERSYDTSFLECYTMIHTKQKNLVERALTNLTEKQQVNKEYVPGLVGMALAKFILKKQSDARNYLKMLQKKPYQSEFADEFENAWLLLADFFISNNKFDMAEELLRKILKVNKSMVKAEEYMGIIKEKEQAYVEAASHYEKAWEMSQKRNAGVGYRLAFNYLKAKRYVESIVVCKDLLKTYPEYPKIQKDILEKAQLHLRT